MARNRIALLTAALILLYAAFVQWIWGWPTILSAWAEVGAGNIVLALALLVGTYFVRAHRIKDYFPRRVILEADNVTILGAIVFAVCLLSSALGVRAALRVDPATALGG